MANMTTPPTAPQSGQVGFRGIFDEWVLWFTGTAVGEIDERITFIISTNTNINEQATIATEQAELSTTKADEASSAAGVAAASAALSAQWAVSTVAVADGKKGAKGYAEDAAASASQASGYKDAALTAKQDAEAARDAALSVALPRADENNGMFLQAVDGIWTPVAGVAVPQQLTAPSLNSPEDVITDADIVYTINSIVTDIPQSDMTITLETGVADTSHINEGFSSSEGEITKVGTTLVITGVTSASITVTYQVSEGGTYNVQAKQSAPDNLNYSESNYSASDSMYVINYIPPTVYYNDIAYTSGEVAGQFKFFTSGAYTYLVIYSSLLVTSGTKFCFYSGTNTTADLCVIAGGAGGGVATNGFMGGGGAGGLRFQKGVVLSALTYYAITVGAGGLAGSNGSDSSFGALLSALGGGYGGDASHIANSGGSGGGGPSSTVSELGANGTTGQGNSGGDGYPVSSNRYGGGGGGAGALGGDAASSNAGDGGAGIDLTSSLYFDDSGIAANLPNNGEVAGGGGGSMYTSDNGTSSASHGGGEGALSNTVGTSGTDNTGGGGGAGASGGSGVVILRWLTGA